MDYSNPKIPEEINYSKESPLREFAVLLGGIGLAIFLLISGINFFVTSLGHLIPFAWEAELFSSKAAKEFINKNDSKNSETEAYLRILAADLAVAMEIPEEIEIHLNWQSSEQINAFATLNGNIIVNQGLLDYVESENELAFVIAHEIAHIKERHPIKSLGSAAAVGLVFSILGVGIDNDSALSTLGTGAAISALSFSRSQETAADELALNTVFDYYGHVEGADDFFVRAQEFEMLPGLLQFVSTHPGMAERVEQIRDRSMNTGGAEKFDVELVSLPPILSRQKDNK